MKKWFAIPALAGAVAIGGVAMVANADKGDNQTTGVLAVEAAGNDDMAKLTVEEVEAKAVESVDGTVTEIDYDSSDNEYEVEVESGSVTYELDINATTGEVVKKETDDKELAVVKSDAKETATAKNKNFITAKEAIAIALKHSPGTVKEVELDDDDKRAHFEIEIKDGKYEYEFEIDAVTGKILDFEKDRDDD
jgi:uncharacterized membrane protein YkoI